MVESQFDNMAAAPMQAQVKLNASACVLELYVLVPRSRYEECLVKNKLSREDGQCHIVLCTSLQQAVSMVSQSGVEFHKGSGSSPPSHLVLRVTFYPLGIAAYTVSRGDVSNQFMSVLHKVSWHHNADCHSWHLIGDLPLDVKRAPGNDPMVFSKWEEII